MKSLVLASQSQARRLMLSDVKLNFSTASAQVDEAAITARLRLEGQNPGQIAVGLARAKALDVSHRLSDAIVIGGDQTLSLADGSMLTKPETRDGLKAQIEQLSGSVHHLHSAAAVVEGGVVLWEQVETVTMTMTALTPAFIDDYVSNAPIDLLGCVGGYQIENGGARLFDAIEGSYFAILGLPLLPLLAYLRDRGIGRL